MSIARGGSSPPFGTNYIESHIELTVLYGFFSSVKSIPVKIPVRIMRFL